MSVDQAKAVVQRFQTDPEFVARIQAAAPDERRAIIEEEGYGDVTLASLSQALPERHGGELSDEEFDAVAGGGSTGTGTIIGAVGVGSIVVMAMFP
ncbi:MAG: Nif11-like leader peptide family RiPP precursor [Actinomycetota bacterium]